MKIYLAGKIGTKEERESLEKIDSFCKRLGFETFLPHRDVGLAYSIKDVEKIFEGDIRKGLDKCDLVVAFLDGLHVGSGTAWEIGYSFAKGIPVIALKTDESPKEGLDYLSSILVASTPFVSSFEELERFLRKINPRS